MDTKEMIQNCPTCMEYSPAQQKETLMSHDIPQYPWQKVGADLFSIKRQNFLVVADYFSLYPEVVTLSRITTAAVKNGLIAIFSRHGTPEVLYTDNGSQLRSSEFDEFASSWEFKQVTSSPHYPQSNGLAESAVKNAKSLIRKAVSSNQDVNKALLAYRATPVISGLSTAEMLMGRRIRTTLPTHPSKMAKPWMKKVVEKRQEIQKQQKVYYNRNATDLPPLREGQWVRIRDERTGRWMMEGTVRSRVAERSYEVLARNGTLYRRNRRVLKPITYKTNDLSVESNPVLIQSRQSPTPNPSSLTAPGRRSLRTRCQLNRWTPGC